MCRDITRWGFLTLVGVLALGVGHSQSADDPRSIGDELSEALRQCKSSVPTTQAKGLSMLTRCAPAEPMHKVRQAISVAMHSQDPSIRACACRTAGDLLRRAPGYQLPYLGTSLGDPNHIVRQAALEGLRDRGMSFYSPEEVRFLIQLLKDPDPEVRLLVYTNLNQGRENAWPAIPVLIEKLDSEPPENRQNPSGVSPLYLVIRTLGTAGRRSPRVVPALLKVYARFPAETDRDRQLREAVIIAIGEIGPFSKESMPFLLSLLRNDKLAMNERALAAGTLGLFGPLAGDTIPEMISLLRLALKGPDVVPGSINAIVVGLTRLREMAVPAIPLLLELAQRPERDRINSIAIVALGDLAPVASDRVAPVLAKLFFAKGERIVSSELSHAMALCGDAATPFAIDALKSGDGEQQFKALRLLAQLGPDARPATPELQRISSEPLHGLRSLAESILQNIDP